MFRVFIFLNFWICYTANPPCNENRVFPIKVCSVHTANYFSQRLLHIFILDTPLSFRFFKYRFCRFIFPNFWNSSTHYFSAWSNIYFYLVCVGCVFFIRKIEFVKVHFFSYCVHSKQYGSLVFLGLKTSKISNTYGLLFLLVIITFIFIV